MSHDHHHEDEHECREHECCGPECHVHGEHAHHHVHGHDSGCGCASCHALDNIFSENEEDEREQQAEFRREITFLAVTGVIFLAALLLEELKKDRWIIDGNYGRTIPLRLQYCDTVIWLDFNRVTCVLGVLRRVLKGRGKTRDDMGALCPERFDWDFIKYTWNFNRSNREKYRRMLSGVPGVSIYVVRSRRALRRIDSELICHQEATQS